MTKKVTFHLNVCWFFALAYKIVSKTDACVKKWYMEIKRDKYLNDLIIRKNNGVVKIITGIRGSG